MAADPTARTRPADPSLAHLPILRARILQAPRLPGIYRWFDGDGKLLYVGKAKNLRSRLLSYVRASMQKEGFRRRGLVATMRDFQLTVTTTELEALVLELHTIRTLKPRFNVSLTRDAHYSYIRVGLHEDFPGVTLVQRKARDGATYFGPFTNSWTQHSTLELLRSLFGFRNCSMGLRVADPGLWSRQDRLPLEIVATKKDRRIPCLDVHIRRCAGPCTGDVLPADYRRDCIDGVVEFYEGRFDAVLARLVARLRSEETDRKYDRVRELLTALRFIRQLERQKSYFDPHGLSADAVGCVRRGMTLSVVVLQVRGGHLVNEVPLTMRGRQGDAELLRHALAQYYADATDIPQTVALSGDVAERDLLEAFLSARREEETALVIAPEEERLRVLTGLATANAEEKLASKKIKRRAEGAKARFADEPQAVESKA